LWFAPGALSPLAQTASLASVKGKNRAIIVAPVPKATDPKRGYRVLESAWQTNLSEVLQRKTREVLAEPVDGGMLHPTFFNAIHKNMKMRHFVRGFIVDVNGDRSPELWDAEKVIEFQHNNPGVALPLQDAELVVVPDRVLRTMVGDRGPQSALRAPTAAPVTDPTKIPSWRGVTDEVLRRVPGIVETDKAGRFTNGNFFTTPAAARTYQSQLSIGMPMPDAQRDALTQRIQILAQARESIVSARQTHEGDSQRRVGIDQQIAEATMKSFASAAQNLDISIGTPFLATRATYQGVISKQLLEQMTENLRLTQYQSLWKYRELDLNSSHTSANGYVTPASVAGYDNLPKHNHLALGDAVVMELESFNDVPEKDRYPPPPLAHGSWRHCDPGGRQHWRRLERQPPLVHAVLPDLRSCRRLAPHLRDPQEQRRV
jgi:hypothetical protein